MSHSEGESGRGVFPACGADDKEPMAAVRTIAGADCGLSAMPGTVGHSVSSPHKPRACMSGVQILQGKKDKLKTVSILVKVQAAGSLRLPQLFLVWTVLPVYSAIRSAVMPLQ